MPDFTGDYVPARQQGEWRLPPGLRRPLHRYLRARWVNFGNPIPLFEHLHKTFGPIAQYTFLGHLIVFVNHPDFVQEILINQAASFRKERTLQRMKILLGEGLITSDDPIHMRQRKLAAPAFHRQRIAGYADTIVEAAAHYMSHCRDGQVIDVNAGMMELSLEMVARTL